MNGHGHNAALLVAGEHRLLRGKKESISQISLDIALEAIPKHLHAITDHAETDDQKYPKEVNKEMDNLLKISNNIEIKLCYKLLLNSNS